MYVMSTHHTFCRRGCLMYAITKCGMKFKSPNMWDAKFAAISDRYPNHHHISKISKCFLHQIDIENQNQSGQEVKGNRQEASWSTSSFSKLQDLPNLPGVRRSALSANPKLFKEYLNESLSAPSLDTAQSSYFEDPEYVARVKTALNPYPTDSISFNDVTARYSLCSRQRDRASNTRPLPYSDINKAPGFVTNKDQMCNFTAYFEEFVPENLEETHRLRVVDITLYVTDDSIEIREPFQTNSGLVQGKFLRRHHVPKPDGSGHYTVRDFHAGAVLTIYNREYTVIKCNSWTFRHLKSIGVDFGHDLPVPGTTDVRMRRLNTSASRVSTASTEKFSMSSRPFTALSKSFYEHDKMVLRFYGFWEGSEQPKPIRYRVRLHYYLTDDAIEIISEYGRNDGRDRVPKFLKKMKILKPSQAHGIMNSSQQDSLDSSCFYHYSDIAVGSSITVVGNEILIYDADPFTRQYMAENDMPLRPRMDIKFEDTPRKYVVQPPPYNGFGSEEDSLQTCSGSLMPKPPKKDGLKAKLHAQQVLRFRMKFKKPRATDSLREFVLQVFLEDDTIQINETPVRNSGFGAGKFLSRSRQHHPDGRRIVPSDVTLGTTLFIQSSEFIIIEADESSLKYMEQSDLWKESSIDAIADKIRPYEDALRDELVSMKDRAMEDVPYDEIVSHLINAGVNLTQQEQVTLCRAMDKKGKKNAKFFRLFRIIGDVDMFASWGSRAISA